MKYTKMNESIVCGFWNILADGLSQNEFMTNGGDAVCTDWTNRNYRILSVLESMLQNCDLVVTVENDHFYWFLNKLNARFKNKIDGIYYIEECSMARKLHKIDPTHTFFDDCRFYASDYSAIYHSKSESPYTSDDGIGIYYKKDKLKFISTNKPKINTSCVYICRGDEQYFISKFQSASGKEVNICGVHLSSGEEQYKEKNRVVKLNEIFIKTKKLPNCIILMDSNSSELYERNYYCIKTCSMAILENDYKNLICAKNHECFKMRHAQGGQPNKYGQFMFDTIDQILIKEHTMGKQIDESFGFATYPKYLYNILMQLRTNRNKRNILFRYSANVNNFRKCPNYKAQKIYGKFGNFLFEIDGTESNRWGEDMNKNTTAGLAKLLNFRGIYEMKNMPLDQQIFEILKYLYPNSNAPSDHPPIAAVIYL